MLRRKEEISNAGGKHDAEIPGWKFVLVNGIPFALILMVVSCLFDMIFDHVTIKKLIQNNFWHYLRTALIAVVFIGLIMRWQYIRSYKKLKKEK